MKCKGPWSEARMQRFVGETQIPLRIACNAASGHPLLASVWCLWRDGRLWCATQQSASLARVLERDPRCAFEYSVESPPYRGIRGPAIATLHADRAEAVLTELIDRYLGDSSSELADFLMSRIDRETAIALEPKEILSWDYSERMGDAA